MSLEQTEAIHSVADATRNVGDAIDRSFYKDGANIVDSLFSISEAINRLATVIETAIEKADQE